MSYYLRAEGVNLGYFVNDTNDLSTTRGGGLLLLESMNKIEEIINKNLPEYKPPEQLELDARLAELNELKEKQNLTPREKNRKRNLRPQINGLKEKIDSQPKEYTTTITKGASWGLFNLHVNEEKEAIDLYTKIIEELNKDTPDNYYKHATFVVDLHVNSGNENYPTDRDSLQTLNRWQQMQAPSLAVCNSGKESCAIDKVRPAVDKDTLKDGQEDFVSASVKQRRKYGRDQKQEFYKKITDINARYTPDLTTLSQSAGQHILDGKIAFIYIDGNGFGAKQKSCENPEDQKNFDESTRKGRELTFSNILQKIHTDADWLTSEGMIRLETLLWGGDEIIWVVPAWQGWWMINEFYQQASDFIKFNREPLYHATGIVFCHHNAPIHRIDALARELADFSKLDRNKNLIAYQILESFDHIQWNGLLPLNGIAMCQTKDFSNQTAGGDDDYNTCGDRFSKAGISDSWRKQIGEGRTTQATSPVTDA